MRDPHVEAIYFKVSSGEDISYRDPEPLSFSNHLGEFCLADGILRLVPAEHFASAQEASQAIDAFLRAWEIETDLKRNLGTIRFNYSHADVIDRNPPPPGTPQVIQAEGICSGIAIGTSLHAHLVLGRYPEPPERFSASEYAQHAYRRWIGYRRGQEPLQAMAYFVLTLMERIAGSRAKACELFKIDLAVRNKMGDLCSERGSALTARKAQSADFDDLSAIEKDWLERAVKRLIFRLGEHASGQPLDQITMENVERL
ncbi:hypothetical protein BWR15_15530 [Pseudomonas sp. T]|nr:hypothetical protein BWR15_15530 [Pseudomonas sp. T]